MGRRLGSFVLVALVALMPAVREACGVSCAPVPVAQPPAVAGHCGAPAPAPTPSPTPAPGCEHDRLSPDVPVAKSAITLPLAGTASPVHSAILPPSFDRATRLALRTTHASPPSHPTPLRL